MSNESVIICVDDERVVLNGLEGQLARALERGYSVECAESGEEALEVMRNCIQDKMPVPVFISDQMMPGIKGHEVLAEVHRMSPLTCNVLLTGQSDLYAVTEAVNHANLYRYIAKPWDGTDLIMTVKEAIKAYDKDLKLEEQNRMLEKYNKELEQLVLERTAELRKAQEELLTKERMATLGKFSMEIAHEIQNPLNFINNFSKLNMDLYEELLESMNADLRTQEVNDILEDIRANTAAIDLHGTRISSILRQLQEKVNVFRAAEGGSKE